MWTRNAARAAGASSVGFTVVHDERAGPAEIPLHVPCCRHLKLAPRPLQEDGPGALVARFLAGQRTTVRELLDSLHHQLRAIVGMHKANDRRLADALASIRRKKDDIYAQHARASTPPPANEDGGESFPRVDWVAVPKALRARRDSRRRRRRRR
jgi:hypothetical protein